MSPQSTCLGLFDVFIDYLIMRFVADKLNIMVCVIVIYICIYNAFTKYY